MNHSMKTRICEKILKVKHCISYADPLIKVSK